jgi:type I restriction enzyme S subunit
MPMLERPISKAGWTRVAFGDVVRLSKARVVDPEAAGIERVVGLEHIEPGDLRIRRWGVVADGTTFTTLFKPGQVLFGKRRAYQRKVAVADFEGVCSGDIYVLEPANDRLMPELLPFLCQTDAFFDHAVGTSAGSLSPRTNWTSLASFEFLLPPIQEQARLVEVLSGVEESFSSCLLAAMRAADLVAAYGKEFFGDSVGDQGEPIGNFTSENIQRRDVVKSETYRIAGVYNRGAGLYESAIISGAETQYRQLHVLKQRQIVMRKLTAWEGAIGIVPADFDGAFVSPEFPTLDVDEHRVQPEYLAWVFRQPAFWREMKSNSRGTAVRRSRLHQRDLMEIRIFVPSLELQAERVQQISQFRDAALRFNSRAEELRRMISVLLKSEIG